MRLHHLIFIAMALGLLAGLGLYYAGQHQPGPWHPIALWLADLLGPVMFVGALKMILAPLIFASIVAGVTSLPDLRELGAIGWKTLAYYLCTTSIAVTLGLVAVETINPGQRPGAAATKNQRAEHLRAMRAEYETTFEQSAMNPAGLPTPDYQVWLARQEGLRAASALTEKLESGGSRSPGDIVRDDIIRPLLMNPFESLSTNPPNGLGIIFFALLLGIACAVVGDPAAPVVAFFNGLNHVILKITHWLMLVSPLAIGCIVAKLVATTGPEVFQSLGWYCLTVVLGIAAHVLVLVTVCRLIGGVGPITLWRGIREAWLIAFTTRSSAATLPVTITNVTENLHVSPKVANFSLPLGATMNMDGTALYQGVAVVFLLQLFAGLDDVPPIHGLATNILIFVTAVLASVGAAAVPNAALVTMGLVASAVGLPLYYIPFIFAVDAVLDMFRTSTNVLGDIVGAVVVNRLERNRLGEPAPAPPVAAPR